VDYSYGDYTLSGVNEWMMIRRRQEREEATARERGEKVAMLLLAAFVAMTTEDAPQNLKFPTRKRYIHLIPRQCN
jgi:hypothetical protein